MSQIIFGSIEIEKITRGESKAQSCASTIFLNLIGSNPNQSNWTSSIDDIQTLTLICVTQLGSFSYGNETCHDLIIDIIETPFDRSELF